MRRLEETDREMNELIAQLMQQDRLAELGLSISYRIVEKMGGRIIVENTEGQGTAFAVFLPVVLPENE